MQQYIMEYQPNALDDINSIFVYVLEKSKEIATAEAYVNRIYARCERIAYAPFAGVLRPDFGDEIRMAVFERSVVILYRVDGDRVRITNLFSGGRDYETLLRNQPFLP